MRKIIRTLLFLLIFAAIFPFVYPWKDGKPMLSWSDLKMPEMPSVALPDIPDISLPGDETTTRKPHQSVKLYRWQGEDGSTQFSNEPPAGAVAYEIVEVNPDANLIQSVPTDDASVAAKTETAESADTTSSLPSPLTVSPGEALQLIEDARNLRELSEERLRQHEALTQ